MSLHFRIVQSVRVNGKNWPIVLCFFHVFSPCFVFGLLVMHVCHNLVFFLGGDDYFCL